MIKIKFLNKLICSSLILFLSTLSFSQTTIKKWTLNDAMSINGIENISFSPNKKYLTYILQKNISTSNDAWIDNSQIHLINLQSRADKNLTPEGNKYSNPQWSFDGKYIAYLFQDKNDNVSHLWFMKADGTEKKQITQNQSAITSFQWSPTHYSIAYVTELHHPALKDNNSSKHPIDVNNTFNYSNLHLITLNNDIGWIDNLLFSGLEKRDKFNLLTWQKNGNTILFNKMPSDRNDIWDIGELTQFGLPSMSAKPVLMSPESIGVQTAQYSNDNTKLALLSSGAIYILALNTGQLTKLATDNGELLINIIGWSQDDKLIYTLEKYHTYYRILALSTNDETFNVIPFPHKMITSPALNNINQTMVFASQDSDQPIELFSSPIKTPKLEQLTHVNAMVKNPLWGRTRVVHWKSTDGFMIEGLLTYPLNYHPHHRYPLLVELHGGPGDSFVQRFVARKSVFPIANFSSNGYFYFRPNVRGSSGYGAVFKHLNEKDWGGGDYQDVISGVQSLIQQGFVDTSKIGILGWSYGGYLAGWAISHSSLFKAASIGGGIFNLVSYTGTNDLPNNFVPANLKDYFWNNKTLYIDRSPIFYVNQIHAPVLLEYGENDRRVPKSQGYELYNALKILNIPVSLLIYPNTAHSIRDPNLLFQSAQRNLIWFQYYLINYPANLF